MEEDDGDGPGPGDAFLLIEPALLGRLLFPYAMAEAERVPPANDTEPAGPPPASGS